MESDVQPRGHSKSLKIAFSAARRGGDEAEVRVLVCGSSAVRGALDKNCTPACEIPSATFHDSRGFARRPKYRAEIPRPPNTQKHAKTRTGNKSRENPSRRCLRIQALEGRGENAQNSTRQRPKKNKRFLQKEAENLAGVKPLPTESSVLGFRDLTGFTGPGSFFDFSLFSCRETVLCVWHILMCFFSCL